MVPEIVHKRVRIYTLTDPRNKNIFYVGRTTMSLERRLGANNYKYANSNCNPHLRSYLMDLEENGHSAIIEEIDTCSYNNRKTVEEYWIQQISAWGFQITNVKHEKNKNYYTPVKTYCFNCQELGLIHRLHRKGDYTVIANKANTTRETARKYVGKMRVPIYLKDAIIEYYMGIASEISDMYKNHNQN